MVVRGEGIPITAGALSYKVAREVADGFCAEKKLVAEIVNEATREVVYRVEPFAENIIPLRPGIRPEGVEHGAQRD